MSEETEYRKWTDNNLVAGAGPATNLEMLRRLKEAIAAQERSSNRLGERVWWLNVVLLVFTVAAFLLTVVQVLVALGVMTPLASARLGGGVVMGAATCWTIAGLACDPVGAALLVWPVLRPGRRRFETMDYVQSSKTRLGAVLLVLGFVLQVCGAWLSRAPR